MADQLSLFVDEIAAEEELPAVELLFTPNGRRRCEHCRRPLTPFGGRLYCLRVGCTGVSR